MSVAFAELPYERAFRRWCEEEGMEWSRLVYPRPEAGGATVAYRIRPGPDPIGRVLLVHGAGNDALFALVGLAKELLVRGYALVAFDLDGHGRASTTRFSPDTIGGAIPAALERARQGDPALPTHAIGVSLGGTLLLHALGGSLADAFASAVAVSAPLQIRFGWDAALNELRPALLGAAAAQRRHLGWWGMVPAFGPVKRGTYPLRLAQAAPGRFGYIAELNRALAKLDPLATAPLVRTPTLLLYGDADRLVPPEQGEALAAAIPDAELIRLPGATHLTAPVEMAATQAIAGWLGSHASPCAEVGG